MEPEFLSSPGETELLLLGLVVVEGWSLDGDVGLAVSSFLLDRGNTKVKNRDFLDFLVSSLSAELDGIESSSLEFFRESLGNSGIERVPKVSAESEMVYSLLEFDLIGKLRSSF